MMDRLESRSFGRSATNKVRYREEDDDKRERHSDAYPQMARKEKTE